MTVRVLVGSGNNAKRAEVTFCGSDERSKGDPNCPPGSDFFEVSADFSGTRKEALSTHRSEILALLRGSS